MRRIVKLLKSPESIVANQWNSISKKVFNEFFSRFFFWQSAEAATSRAPWKKVFLKILRKTPVWSFFFNKVAGPRPATLFKKRLWYRCFPVSLSKFLRNFFIEHLGASESKMSCEVFTGSGLWKKLLLKMSQYLRTSANGCFWTIFVFLFNLFLVSTIVIYYENMTKSSMECKNKHRVKR